MPDQAISKNQPESSRQPLPGDNELSSYHYQQAVPSPQYRTSSAYRAEQVAKALGWFSIGLGIARLLAPRRMARIAGVAERPGLLRAVGVRDIASGVGIVSQYRPTGWLWSRVAGDALDLALLGAAARSSSNNRRRIAWTTAALAGVAVLDLLSSVDSSKRDRIVKGTDTLAVKVTKSIRVDRSPEECYRFWRDFESFPRFMSHLESVQVTGDRTTHWKAKGPVGMNVEWDAELNADQPGEYLAWRSVTGSEVDNSGVVRFEATPDGQGTMVHVEMHYSPPAGVAGAVLAKLFGEEPSQQVEDDLQRFKSLLEAGETAAAAGKPL